MKEIKNREINDGGNVMDLKTRYLGLSLKSPIIVGASTLTSNIESLKSIETYGAGAVVLKSLFEEEIHIENYVSNHMNLLK